MKPSTADHHRRHRSGMDSWREAFVLELRVHDVPGIRIGDALAEVDTHCEDTGQSPSEAFGDAEDYARALLEGLPPERRSVRTDVTGAAVGVGSLLGLSLLLPGVDGLTGQHRAGYSWGALVSLTVLSVAVLAFAPMLATLLRPRHRYRVALGVAVLLAVPVVSQLLLPGVALTAPAWPSVLVGSALFAASMLGLTLIGLSANDRVIDPRTGADRFHMPAWLSVLVVAMLPVTVVVIVGLLVAFPESR